MFPLSLYLGFRASSKGCCLLLLGSKGRIFQTPENRHFAELLQNRVFSWMDQEKHSAQISSGTARAGLAARFLRLSRLETLTLGGFFPMPL